MNFQNKNLYHLATNILTNKNKDNCLQYLELISQLIKNNISGIDETFIIEDTRTLYETKKQDTLKQKIESNIKNNIIEAFSYSGEKSFPYIDFIFQNNIDLLQEEKLIETTHKNYFDSHKFRCITNDDVMKYILNIYSKKDKEKLIYFIKKENLLHHCVQYSLLSSFDFLISIGCEPNQKDKNGKTPIMKVPSFEVLSYLDKYNLDYFTKDNDGCDLINHVCFLTDSKKMINFILTKGKVDNQLSIIDTLKTSNKDEIINILSKYTSDLNKILIDGDNILNYAIKKSKWHITKPLINDFKIDVNFTNSNNFTCLDYLFFNFKSSGDLIGTKKLNTLFNILEKPYVFHKKKDGLGISEKLIFEKIININNFDWFHNYKKTYQKSFKEILDKFTKINHIDDDLIKKIQNITTIPIDGIKHGKNEEIELCFKVALLFCTQEKGLNCNIIKELINLSIDKNYECYEKRLNTIVDFFKQAEDIGIPLLNKSFDLLFEEISDTFLQNKTIQQAEIISILLNHKDFLHLKIDEKRINEFLQNIPLIEDKNDKNKDFILAFAVQLKTLILENNFNSVKKNKTLKI